MEHPHCSCQLLEGKNITLEMPIFNFYDLARVNVFYACSAYCYMYNKANDHLK